MSELLKIELIDAVGPRVDVFVCGRALVCVLRVCVEGGVEGVYGREREELLCLMNNGLSHVNTAHFKRTSLEPKRVVQHV